MSIKGIDISSYQSNIDWVKAKADGVEFAIIRAGYGSTISQKDKEFENHIKGALSAGVKVGIYWFGYAYNKDTATTEANVCDQVIRPYKDKIELPVFYDWEYDSERYIKGLGITPTKDLVTTTTIAFMDRIKELGYKTGYYTNWDYLSRLYNYNKLKSYDLWMASYSSTRPTQYNCSLQQYSASGRVSGIYGNVDMNWLYKDYSSKETKPSAPSTPTTPKEPTTTSDIVYTVKAGDTLSSIAKQYNTTWEALAKYNNISNPNIIYGGQKIKIPSAKPSTSPVVTEPPKETKPVVSPETTYIVKAGDTLSSIAAKFGTTWKVLAEYNNIVNPNVIYGGQKIKIPGTSAPTGYRIKVNVPALNCRQGPGMGYGVNRVLFSGETYGVTEEKKDSAGNSWGKLKEVNGWCALRYTKKI